MNEHVLSALIYIAGNKPMERGITITTEPIEESIPFERAPFALPMIADLPNKPTCSPKEYGMKRKKRKK